MSITIKNKKVEVRSKASVPFTWGFVYDGNCVSVVTKSEVYTVEEDYNVLTIIYDLIFANEACLQSTGITFSSTDGSGCTKTATITVPNVCSSFSIGQITSLGNYRFSISPSGGSGGYTYEWLFDQTLFSAIGDLNSNQVQFSYIGSQPLPDSTNITVTVRDTNGCEKTTTLAFYFCKPVLVPQVITLSNVPASLVGGQTVKKQSTPTAITGTLCPNTTLDYATFTPSLPTGIYYQVIGSSVKFGTDNAGGTVLVPYTIKDSEGTIVSSTITLVIPDAVEMATISIPNNTIHIDCGLSEDDTFDIPIEDLFS